jgi:hypothetical protein
MDPYLFALQIVRSYSKCLNLGQPFFYRLDLNRIVSGSHFMPYRKATRLLVGKKEAFSVIGKASNGRTETVLFYSFLRLNGSKNYSLDTNKPTVEIRTHL